MNVLGKADPVTLDPASDAARLKQAFGCFPSGVIAVCAAGSDGPVGMLVSSFTSVSLDPPLVSICTMDTSRTWSQLRTVARIGLSVLGESHHDVCRQFCQSADRFANVEVITTAEGAVLLPEASAWLDCSVYDEITAGDHQIVLLRIHTLHARPATAPLVFHGSGYHRLRT